MKTIYDLIEYITQVPMRGVMQEPHPYFAKRHGPRKRPEPGLNRSRKLEGKPGCYDGKPVTSRYH